MISFYINENNLPIMKADSKFQASLFLWTIVFAIKAFDAWIIMLIFGALHNTFNILGAAPNFWMSFLISFAISGFTFANRKVDEGLSKLELK